MLKQQLARVDFSWFPRRALPSLISAAVLVGWSAPARSASGGGKRDPYSGRAHVTGYYIHEVKTALKAGKGIAVTLTYLDGGKETRYLSWRDYRRAEMQAVVAKVSEAGERHVFARLRRGTWKQVPANEFGKGNKGNPLAPWVHVAADQRIYPYGSRVFIPQAVGYETPCGKTLDGYFWVADTGNAIKGPLRFDVFVGSESCYWKVLARDIAMLNADAVVEPLPKPPDGLNPKKMSEVGEILLRLGYRIGSPINSGPIIPDQSVLTTQKALVRFQRQHPAIPEVEYGNNWGAVTQWYLTQAALEVEDQGRVLKPVRYAPAAGTPGRPWLGRSIIGFARRTWALWGRRRT